MLERMGWTLGQTVTIKGTIYPGDWPMTIRGIFRGRDKTVDESPLLRFSWRKSSRALSPPAIATCKTCHNQKGYAAYCVDSNGAKIWAYKSDYYINGSPAVADGQTVFGGCDAILHVISMADGKQVKVSARPPAPRAGFTTNSRCAATIAGRPFRAPNRSTTAKVFGTGIACSSRGGGEDLYAHSTTPGCCGSVAAFGRNQHLRCAVFVDRPPTQISERGLEDALRHRHDRRIR